MFTVSAQFNTFDSCPKNELQAWDWESARFDTLQDCILWLINRSAQEGENGLVGFRVETDTTGVIMERVATHYPIAVGGVD